MITAFYKHRSNFFCCFFIISFAVLFTVAAVAQPVVSLTPVIQTGLSLPIQFVNAADGSNRVFIVQKEGTIRTYDADFNFLSTFLTVTNITTAGERGLLSMAFHPDYPGNGFFYVYYTNAAGDLELARYQVSSNANIADAASKVIVITIPHPVNANHNGGELHFGSDGFLYLSTGDGGGGGDVPNNAQNTNVLLGKILRFNVNTSATTPYYTIPAGNPYGNEVFDLGLRNPYRWSFDQLTNDMWIGDVGQDSYEEINFRPAGATAGVNYGWRCYEGNNTFNTAGCAAASAYAFPAYTYPSQDPAAAITGGIVYRGTASPDLQGYYVAADFYSGIFYLINPDGAGGWTTTTQTLTPTGMVDFGETENGEAYVVSLTGNSVYRINATSGGPLPVTLSDFTGNFNSNAVKLNWKTALEQNVQQFEIEYSTDGSSFSKVGTVQATNIATGSAYNFTHSVNTSGPFFYRLKMVDTDGSFTYSNTIRINMGDFTGNIVSPSVITNGVINVNLGNTGYNTVEMIRTDGTRVFKRKVKGQNGRIQILTGALLPGIYIIRLNGEANGATQRILIQ